jgi:hypothetical protein
LWAFLYPFKSALSHINWQNWTTHETDVLDSQPVRPTSTYEVVDKWKRNQKTEATYTVVGIVKMAIRSSKVLAVLRSILY